MSHPIQAFAIGEIAIRQHNGLFSLNDLHKAAGNHAKQKPSEWLRNQQTQDLAEEISKAGIPAFETKRGNGAGTYACRELVIAYAAWINAAFHLKVIRVFLAATQPQAGPAIAYDRISPAQAQDLKEIVAAIVQAGIQGYGETWARLQRKFKVNSYLELPATQHLEARAYLLAKLPAAVPPRARRMVELPPGKTIVDIRKLAAIWHDLGRLHQRLDGLGVLESDLPPAWWESKAISPDQGSIFS
ncbi:MAG: KilA-N domain-containing protein [Comamonas sp.]|nr:KilA-N domain-containing protein [Comamonas sp.]